MAVAAGTSSSGNGDSQASWSIDYPSSTAARELLVLGILYSSARSLSTPSGWSPIRGIFGGSARMSSFWRVADGTESGALTGAFGGGTSDYCAIMSRFTGLWFNANSIYTITTNTVTADTYLTVDMGTLPANERGYAFGGGYDLTAPFDDVRIGGTGWVSGISASRANDRVLQVARASSTSSNVAFIFDHNPVSVMSALGFFVRDFPFPSSNLFFGSNC